MGTRVTGCTTYTQDFEGAGGISLLAQWEVGYSAWLISVGPTGIQFDDLQLEGQARLLGHALRIGPIVRDLGQPPPDEVPHWQTSFAKCCRGAFERDILETCANDLRSRYR